MTWDHLDSDLCQHVITLINRALDSPDGPHKGFSKCLALRQRLVTALLHRGLMRVITDLQDLVQESLFQVGPPLPLTSRPPPPFAPRCSEGRLHYQHILCRQLPLCCCKAFIKSVLVA